MDEAMVTQATQALPRDAGIALLEGRRGSLGGLGKVDQVQEDRPLSHSSQIERLLPSIGVPPSVLGRLDHSGHAEPVTARLSGHSGTASVTTWG